MEGGNIMNWNKVINVLILIFLVINILLFGWQKVNEDERYTLPDDREKQMQNVLRRNGIGIYLTIPEYFPMRQVELFAPKVDSDRIRRSMLGDIVQSEIDAVTLGERIFNENESLTFYVGEQDGYIFYKSVQSSYVPENMTKGEVDKVALEFAEAMFGENVDMEVTYRKSISTSPKDGYRLELNERYKEDLIFQTFIKLDITPEGIKEALAVRYDPVDYIGPKKNIYPLDEVAYNLMYFLEDELDTYVEKGLAKFISNIDIGYYLVDVDKRKYEYQLDPYYRIVFKDGDTYYINAYTNDISMP